MLWISIIKLQQALDATEYKGVADNNTAKCVYWSPHTDRPIVIPLDGGDSLPDQLVRYLLRDEPVEIVNTIIQHVSN
jgi:hypothetical protein